jgi:hypothetical protein
MIVSSQGSAVPFWFVPADAVLEAMEDGVLTIAELAALPGRITGTATRFNEELHPHPLPPALGGGGHPNPKLVQSARGRTPLPVRRDRRERPGPQHHAAHLVMGGRENR